MHNLAEFPNFGSGDARNSKFVRQEALDTSELQDFETPTSGDSIPPRGRKFKGRGTGFIMDPKAWLRNVKSLFVRPGTQAKLCWQELGRWVLRVGGSKALPEYKLAPTILCCRGAVIAPKFPQGVHPRG